MRLNLASWAPSKAIAGRQVHSICRVARPAVVAASKASGAKENAPAPVSAVKTDVKELKADEVLNLKPQSSPNTSLAKASKTNDEVLQKKKLEISRVRLDLPTPAVAVRNLVEHARFGHLCSVMSGMHHRRAGYPFGTLVDFATDAAGYPIFCLSPLAIHPRHVDHTAAANIFFAKHANERKERFISGNFVYYRMNQIVDIYFVGGFGTVQWIDPQNYASWLQTSTMLALNEHYACDLPKMIHTIRPADEMNFISIDAHGCDVRVRHGSEFTVERLGFGTKVHNKREAMEAVEIRIREARSS
eukprot:gene10491-8457_t